MSREHRSDFIVGLTVILCALAVIGATMWVNQTSLGKPRTRIVARFRDVASVRVGSVVVIRGVQAGRVEAVELADGGWVRMRLKLDEAVQLPNDPVVLLNASSLFGEWQATITSGAAVPDNVDVRRQVAEARGDPGTIPGALLPDIAQLTTVAGGIAGNVASVAERVKVAFDDRAAIELRASIANFAELSGELAKTVRRQSRNLDGVAVDVHGGAQEMRAAAETFRRIAGRIDTSTSAGQLDSIVADLSHAARQLEATTTEMRGISQRLVGSQRSLDLFLARSDSVMNKVNAGHGSLGMLVNDPRLYQRTDSLVALIQALVTDIRANPKRYVNVRLF
jgi:phospholipid/cholesterol/gamma-HCH transport system substrate-binding protein